MIYPIIKITKHNNISIVLFDTNAESMDELFEFSMANDRENWYMFENLMYMAMDNYIDGFEEAL
jgi:hypothetical protein